MTAMKGELPHHVAVAAFCASRGPRLLAEKKRMLAQIEDQLMPVLNAEQNPRTEF
jgi:hypothetical protein